jgi:type I restriction enzyme S subunit
MLIARSKSKSRHIAEQLDEKTSKIDALTAETERFVELARERRSALITSAVTGQVDKGKVA